MSTRALGRVNIFRQAPCRKLSTASISRKWEGSSTKDHITETSDSHNVEIDGAKGGAQDRASTDGSSAATEKDTGKNNERAKKDHPKAPEPVIGMNDERGGKGGG